MEQYIKITSKNEEGDLLGTFKLSIDINFSTRSINSIVEKHTEITLDSSIYNIPSNSTVTLYNVPIVYEYDNRTPIQFHKNSESNVNLMLLEEHKYNLSFNANHELDKEYLNQLDIFHSLLKFTDEVLELVSNTNIGFLSFGSYVGKSYLDIYKDKKPIFKIPFEVRSRKIDYATEYAAMIGDLSKHAQGLLYESKSPLFQSFELDNLQNKSSYEDFMLLEYLFKDENLPSTIEYLSRNLYSALTSTVEEVPTSFASNINPNDLIDVFSNSDNLTKTDDVMWQERTKGHIPLKINETKYIDDIDVPENRFYKNFLESIENLINELLKKSHEGYIRDQLLIYKESISAYLSQRYFKDISMMDYVPLNSQLLQKKEGYRDILQYYLMFEMGFKLNWSEVTNEFKGNEKKLFELYEYWCYFELIDVLNQISINTIDFSDIFDKVKDEDKDEFSISLKHNLLNTFYINVGDKSIEVDLTYNRSFYRTSNEFKSYSVTLRPDYSLIVRDGEKEHILHFDAKYKLYIDSESFKNEDIVKMHAYKDAIVGTVGAYVLYPGEKKRLYYEHLDDKLESVGAFPLSPGENKYNRDYLRDFILSMIHKLIEN